MNNLALELQVYPGNWHVESRVYSCRNVLREASFSRHIYHQSDRSHNVNYIATYTRR